jgi:hypothetical protein
MTYSEALATLTRLIISYPEIRKTGSLTELQTLRDEISECLFHFGEMYAHIRSAAERGESQYKTCCDERKKHWRQKFGDRKAGLADLEAVLECKNDLSTMHDKNEDYYLAQSLINRTDQVLHAISSRIKIIGKHE